MKFSELTECPFCGCDEFYTKYQMRGSCEYQERFDGKESERNCGMHDGLIYTYGKRAYCSDCQKYLGNKEQDTISKEVEAKLAELRGGE